MGLILIDFNGSLNISTGKICIFAIKAKFRTKITYVSFNLKYEIHKISNKTQQITKISMWFVSNQ